MSEIDTRLDQWVEAGLISPETASDLRRFDHEHPAAVDRELVPDAGVRRETPSDTAAPPAAPPPPAPAPPRSLAIVGEVVGYLGAVLTVTALTFLVSRTWPDLTTAGRIGLVAALTAVVAVAAVLAARAPQPPAQRLASVLLLATVGLSGWLAWVVVDGAMRVDDDAVALPVTAVMAVVAGTIYALRRRGLAQIALLGALAGLVAALLQPWNEGAGAEWMGPAWAAIGVAWIGLAIARALAPPAAALVTGGLLAVFGLQSAGFDEDTRVWTLAAAVVLAVAMIVTAVARRELAPLMVPGGIGLLVSMPQFIERLVGDAMVTWLGVLLTGVGLVVLAVWMVRGRRRPPASPPP